MQASSELVLDFPRETGSSVLGQSFTGLLSFNNRDASATVIGMVYFSSLSNSASQFITKLNSFKFLQNNWDSYGAIPPSAENIENAITLIKKADQNDLPIYFVAPGPNGELAIEFKKGNKEATAFINPDGSTELILNEGDHHVLEGTVESNYKDLLSFINS